MDAARLSWAHAGVSLELTWSASTAPRVTAFAAGNAAAAMSPGVPLLEVLTVDEGHALSCDALVRTVVGQHLRYVGHQDITTGGGRALLVHTHDALSGISAELTLHVADDTSVLRATATIRNDSESAVVLRSVTAWSTSLGASAVDPRADAKLDGWSILRGDSEWLGEGRWVQRPVDAHSFPDLAEHLTGHDPRGAYAVTSTGTWSTGTHLPVGALSCEQASLMWAWQIEHNGSWRWEIGRQGGDGYFALSGPTDDDHQWSHELAPGETFTTVPVAVTLAADLTGAAEHLTHYRRRVRRPHPDNTDLSVVFNDYMNTLNGDPSTERLLPLVAAAADVGAQTFCIDAGWYDDGGDWWDSVGEWMPSTTRFPGGLQEVTDQIHARGMVAGLWLEPEVVGVRSPVADRLPAEAFWQRRGRRIVEHGRYHLDLRHPAAREHLDSVIDRLISDFGIGYFKLDYNIAPGAGSDGSSDSPGDALLGHNRALLDWVDGVLDRWPALVLENCGSGAMRADFALLSRLQLQSTSDQQDPLKYAPIAATAPMMMLPEQAASWAYPSATMSQEEAAFTLVTGLSGRLYLSGYLNQLPATHLDLVREAVAVAKDLKTALAASVPRWPLGLPQWDDPWVALVHSTPTQTYLVLWSRDSDLDSVDIPLEALLPAGSTGPATRTAEAPEAVKAEQVFPARLPAWATTTSADGHHLTVTNRSASVGARIFRVWTR